MSLNLEENDSITEHNYKSYLKGLLRILNDNGLTLIDRQFELITEYKPKDYQISAAQMSFNLSKNRSQKIIPGNLKLNKTLCSVLIFLFYILFQ